jgi:peroxin-16
MLSTNKHKDKALVTAFAMELISRSLRRTPSNSADLEREEYARRDRDILWYLLRGSVWETYSRSVHSKPVLLKTNISFLFRPKVEAVVEKTANTPILGVLSSIVKDWIPLVDGYYYCELFLRNPYSR